MKEEFVNCIIIGHSSDDGDDINKLFLACGADDFEAKPTSYKSLRNLIDKHIVETKFLKYYDWLI